jgi:hypothetical protein
MVVALYIVAYLVVGFVLAVVAARINPHGLRLSPDDFAAWMFWWPLLTVVALYFAAYDLANKLGGHR